MCNEYGWTYFVEQCGVRIGIYIKIYRAKRWRHLSKELVQCLRRPAKLNAIKKLRPNPQTKTVEPQFFIKCLRYGNFFCATTGITAPWLVNKIYTKSFA